MNNKEKGFSLIESMIATLIMAIAFTGVYTLSAFSSQTLTNSTNRQKMQLVANQMIEVIDGDYDNILMYDLDFTTCSAPGSGVTDSWEVNRYKWCRMLDDFLGTTNTGDVREIDVVTTTDGIVVNITLESKNGEAIVALKKLYSD